MQPLLMSLSGLKVSRARLRMLGCATYYNCVVLGALHGFPARGTHSQRIVRHDGFDSDEHARISHLTVTSID